MRIWIDLANSPHVLFFRALIPELNRRGHEVELTARDFAETASLAKAAGLDAQVIGSHGGKEIAGKARNLLSRARALRSWASGRRLDLALSHNSYSQILAARAMGLKSVTLMDYEHQPANHLAFRLASRVIVPREIPDHSLSRYGARVTKLRRYAGTKEDVYLADFKPDPAFDTELRQLRIEPEDILVLVRPPATEALYHRFENELFASVLEKLASNDSVKVLMLPRTSAQGEVFKDRKNDRFILLDRPLDGPNLIAAADLIISAGGTMNREAAALGTPAATVYAGEWGAVDEGLVRQGRLIRIRRHEDLDRLTLRKKGPAVPRRQAHVLGEVADLILGS